MLFAILACEATPRPAPPADGARPAQLPVAPNGPPLPADVFVTDTTGLDSCARLDAGARRQANASLPEDALPSPRPGSWADAKRVTLDSFSIEIPAVARARTRDEDGSYWVDSLPTCRFFCALQITFSHDSTGRGLDAYADALRTVDSTAGEDAKDWLPGPPSPITVDGDAGIRMETACGDCTSGEIVVMRDRRIATIAYNIDDRDGYQPGLVCRLERVARTFKWRT